MYQLYPWYIWGVSIVNRQRAVAGKRGFALLREVSPQRPVAARAEAAVVADEHRSRLRVALQVPPKPGQGPAGEGSAVRHLIRRTVADVQVGVDRSDLQPL